MIDEESERAVERWVKLGDQVAGQRSSDRAVCARCGSRDRVLGRGARALCAHCFLERGPIRN